MNDREAVEMMQRCKHELISLRQQVDQLRPRAEAYDAIAKILNLMRHNGVACDSVDIVWLLDKSIKEVESNKVKTEVEK